MTAYRDMSPAERTIYIQALDDAVRWLFDAAEKEPVPELRAAFRVGAMEIRAARADEIYKAMKAEAEQ